MMTEDHAYTAREFLAASDRESDAGDDMQAAEKLWEAFSHAVTAISLERGWPYGTHRVGSLFPIYPAFTHPFGGFGLRHTWSCLWRKRLQ